MAYNLVNIRQDKPSEKGKILVYWLAGSGFVFKFSNDVIICVDPYLSDKAEELFGFRRLSAAPVRANQLFFDLLLITHEHADHFDEDSFGELTRSNPGCKVISTKPCLPLLENRSVDYKITAVGDVSEFNGITIRTVAADHGELSPDASGFIITYEGRHIYFTGDTAYSEELMAEAIKLQPEIIIPCMNGAFGNMNEEEAATLVNKCYSRIAIPCHFWLFAEHGGSPGKFKECLQTLSPQGQLLLLTPGRGVEI